MIHVYHGGDVRHLGIFLIASWLTMKIVFTNVHNSLVNLIIYGVSLVIYSLIFMEIY